MAIIHKDTLRLRYLRDPLSIRLGELAVTLGRVSLSVRDSKNPTITRDAFEEAKYFIKWTAADAEPEIAAELVSMQRLITLLLRAWDNASHHKGQRMLLSVQAKHWSDRALEFSGLGQ